MGRATDEATRAEELRDWNNTDKSASYLGLKKPTLEKWRVVGGGPEFAKFGRAVRYSRASLESYAASHTRMSTSE